MIQPSIVSVIITALGAVPPAQDSTSDVPRDHLSAKQARTSITLQPFSLLWESVTAGVETGFSDKVSGIVDVSVTIGNADIEHRSITYSSKTTDRRRGVSLESGVNYFLWGLAPAGLWVGPRVQFHYSLIKSNFNDTDPTGALFEGSFSSKVYDVGGSFLVGYNAILGNGFTVQVGVGLGAAYGWGSLTGPNLGTVPATSAFPSTSTDGSNNDVRFNTRGLLALGWSM
jgi:hypothetical protein